MTIGFYITVFDLICMILGVSVSKFVFMSKDIAVELSWVEWQNETWKFDLIAFDYCINDVNIWSDLICNFFVFLKMIWTAFDFKFKHRLLYLNWTEWPNESGKFDLNYLTVISEIKIFELILFDIFFILNIWFEGIWIFIYHWNNLIWVDL